MADHTQAKDHGFRSVTSRDPEGAVRELGGLGWDVPVRVKPVRTIVSVRVDTDQLFEVTEGRRTRLFHFEAESHFATKKARIALRRSIIAAVDRNRKIRTTLVLHDPKRPARALDPKLLLDFDSIQIHCEFRVARLWEMNPEQILARDRTQLMPMVMAMKSSPAQIREASLRIETVKDESERRRLFEEMVTFGSLLYNETEITDLIGRISRKMLPPMEVIRETQIGKRIREIAHHEGRAEGRNEGRVEGRNEGRAEGRLEGRLELLRQVLAARFPDLEIPASALPRHDEEISQLINELLTAKDPRRIRRLILGPRGR